MLGDRGGGGKEGKGLRWKIGSHTEKAVRRGSGNREGVMADLIKARLFRKAGREKGEGYGGGVCVEKSHGR